ncbi:alcohol dehydrogenase catalytic domain-containing protein [Jatrophihabitans sp. DSM 44399]|uniref:Alcohol dehydrogenase catalytic domain-containing protein n=1 Tax=Jatrophihabitans lederbergiae TaxID=3075547 RepID=A0ABU2JE39_9ACTN|nr:alcohol dehydrogenase catalytic domain-containing protein [Jatrophihabitans sp. DSM 44399]MDT0263260.1 alcohol dehydrogenase catalytic domain-containing protein [Jatrophihabitans sp. DSM 44399]
MLACVCGSDLWFYRGISDLPHGGVGHEFIGVVDEIGTDVSGLQVGDFVISPFSFSDGTCRNCQHGFHTACVHGGFFGQGGDGDGGQAEYVRVPQASGTLVKVPGSDFTDETMASLLALTDVMATGYHAAVSADVQAGMTVAVVGDGAVGLSGVLASKLLGADRIIVLGSTHEDRHNLAREWGATDIIQVRGDEAVEQLKKLTDGFGADAVLECVGTKDAAETAFAIAAAGAIVGRVGVPHDVELDAQGTFYRNVGMRGGPAPARHYQPELLKQVLDGSINPGKVFDLTTDLTSPRPTPPWTNDGRSRPSSR